jgi:hypothetical protein
MVTRGTTVAPVAAALSAMSAIVCCVPIGFTTAAATAGLGAVVEPYQPWLLCAAVVLLTVGAFQLRRATRLCANRPTLSIVVFGISAAIVAAVVLFPQVVAGLVADWLS